MGSGFLKSLSGRAARWEGRRMLNQGIQEAATQEHFHLPPPIAASRAQATVITIALVPKLHPSLTRHFTLLGQGGFEGLNGPHVTMCLALLQGEIIRKLLCRSLLLTSAPTWQEGQSITVNN